MAGDVDYDGDIDLISGPGSAGQYKKLYRNDGEGNFPASGRNIGPEGFTSEFMGLADVNGGGGLDLFGG